MFTKHDMNNIFEKKFENGRQEKEKILKKLDSFLFCLLVT